MREKLILNEEKTFIYILCKTCFVFVDCKNKEMSLFSELSLLSKRISECINLFK